MVKDQEKQAATTFTTAGTYYLIDLGQTYDASGIDQIVISYKEYNEGDMPVKGYKIQYSADSVNFTDVKEVSGEEFKAQITKEPENLVEIQDVSGTEGKVRYVKLYYPDSYMWGIQATEIAVLDTNQDVQTVEVEKCAEAAGVTVTPLLYNTITYNITAGENQESYVYMAYLDGNTEIGHIVEAGKDYTVTGVESGEHTLKIVAIDNGKISDGITSESFTVIDISTLVSDAKNIANKNNNPSVSVYSVSGLYDGHSLSTSNVILDGKLTSGEGTDAAMRTATGSPQEFVVDLGNYYAASEFEKVILAYSNPRTYAGTAKVEFSRDGIEYVEVGSNSGYTCSKDNAGTADVNAFSLENISAYTKEAVRFVKVTLSAGNSNYGYVVNEFGLIANTENPTIITPDIAEAAALNVEAVGLEKIKYSIVAGENQEDYTYTVKVGGDIIDENAEAGTEYIYEGLAAGTYTVTVLAQHNGWVSAGISKDVIVDGYVNYINTSLNLALKSAHPDVTAACDSDNRQYDNPNTGVVNGSQGIGAEITAIHNGVYTDHAHHTGYLQTRPDNDEATIDYDLGKEYAPSDIYSIIALYESTGNAATEYEILLSGDGEEFEQVVYVKDAKFETFAGNAMLIDAIDTSEYTQDTVRYIKYHIINGNYMKHSENEDGTPAEYGCSGYHLCELAVMGDQDLLPEKVTNVTATSPEYKKLVITWQDIEDDNCTYSIYLGESRIASDIPAGTQTKEFIVRAGTYKVKVGVVRDGLETKSDEILVTVEEETTTAEPTTKPDPTTQVPTTQAPTTVAPTTATPQTTTSSVKVGKAKILKAKAGKKKVSLTLKKVKGAKGYKIKYSTSKKFKKAKTKLVKSTKVTIKKLKKGKVYYFKACAYKVVNGKKVWGAWSASKQSKKVK